ncbi:MAG TPA: hypothetical protein VGR35_07330 [Tepidisphaeraceae bacterium]|nr:hypothetical protein [Tepidisphaeraceae bacterium]
MKDETLPALSRDGLARREEILKTMHRAASRRRAARRARLTAGFVAAAVVVIGLLLSATNQHRDRQLAISHIPTTRSADVTTAEGNAEREKKGVGGASGESTPALVPLAPEAPPAKYLNDEELLKLLADAGQPAGLAYVDDRALLVLH